VLPQALKIIFEVQRKKSNEKISRKKRKSFSTYKTHVVAFWTSFTFKPHNFFLLIHFKQFKMLSEHCLKFYKLSSNSNNNRATNIQGIF